MRNFSADEARAVAARYSVDITGEVGTTDGRFLAAVAYVAVVVIATLLVVGFPLMLKVSVLDGIFLSLAGVALVLGFTTRLYLVDVPKYVGLITTNLFGGQMHVFGTGINIKLPWETYTAKDFINGRVEKIEKTSRFLSKEGIPTVFSWSVQFTPRLPVMPLYIRTPTAEIAADFVDKVESTLSAIVPEEDAKELRSRAMVTTITTALNEALAGQGEFGAETLDDYGSTMEERFGISIDLCTLNQPTFDKDYQEALVASALRAVITKDAKLMADELHIKEDVALRTIMILNKESVNEQVFTIQANENIAAAAAGIAAALREAQSTIKAVRAARKPKGGA